jgi:hypothetical protein
MNRSERYIITVDNEPNSKIYSVIEQIRETVGPIRLRGRHSNRKELFSQLGWSYRPGSQNDVPWRYGERIAIYKR